MFQQEIYSTAIAFSSVDDSGLTFLRYLTLEYHIAELIQRDSSSDRESMLRKALDQYERFLTRLDEYELLSVGDKKLFEQYMANPSTFTLAPMNDAAARRDTKVRRFREEKELKQKLEVCLSVQ